MSMYIIICPGLKRVRRDDFLAVKLTNAVVEFQLNWPMGMLLAKPILKPLNIRGEVSSINNLFENPKMENVDQLPPHQEMVVHGYAWQHSPQEAVGFWSWTG